MEEGANWGTLYKPLERVCGGSMRALPGELSMATAQRKVVKEPLSS